MKENETMTDDARFINQADIKAAGGRIRDERLALIEDNMTNLLARMERLEAMSSDGVAEPFDTHFVPKSEYDEAVERSENAKGSLAAEKIKVVDLLCALECIADIAEEMDQKYGPPGK